MIITKDIMRMYDIEFVNSVHKSVIAAVDIIEPIVIDKKAYFKSRLENPAIRLLAQTPVSGKGTDAKPARAIYFFIFDFLLSITDVFL